MAFELFPFFVATVLWGGVGIVLPIVIPQSPNRNILQVMLMLTAISCWLFWLCCYLSQMNPLIGPQIERKSLLLMAREWDNQIFA